MEQASAGTGNGQRIKQRVALTSVGAAVALTSMKLVVGLLTGSLGILAEAAHSALDLVAAIMTLFAVHISERPADSRHNYGYGKIESLSALAEAALLLFTCVWVINEAIQRLFFTSVEIEANLWAFLVMGTSIAVDFGRSRALAAAAKKYDSQALEGDALHFSTDIWSSCVVIGGLALVRVAEWGELPWLIKADAVAAIGVAIIVAFVSMDLAKRSIACLLDAIPSDVREAITEAAAVAGVLEVKRVRVRKSGAQTFADITLVVNPDTSFERSQAIAAAAETAVISVLPRSDVVVHIVPLISDGESALVTVRRLAAEQGIAIHNVRVFEAAAGRSTIELHAEVVDSLSLAEAHAKVTALEESIRKHLPYVDDVSTHIEPTLVKSGTPSADPADEAELLKALRTLPEEAGVECQPHHVVIHRAPHELSLSFHCKVDASSPIGSAHELAERLEGTLRRHVPHLGQVVIHTEPKEP